MQGVDESRPSLIDGIPSATLLGRIRAGDRDALGVLYTALFDTLWSVAVLQSGAGDVAEEVVHDVFLWLWTHRDTIDVKVDIRVYLTVAVRNRTRNFHKHTQVTRAVEDAVSSARVEVPAFGQHDAVSDAMVEDQEFREAYRRALNLLDDRERLAVLLRWEQDMTLEQIGKSLGISTVGARKVVLRAQQKLQAALTAYQEPG